MSLLELIKLLDIGRYVGLALGGFILLCVPFVFSFITSVYTLKRCKDEDTTIYNMNIANAVIAGLFSVILLLGLIRCLIYLKFSK
jgi:cytochrome c biogenesis factor